MWADRVTAESFKELAPDEGWCGSLCVLLGGLRIAGRAQVLGVQTLQTVARIKGRTSEVPSRDIREWGLLAWSRAHLWPLMNSRTTMFVFWVKIIVACGHVLG
ncbi:hypothetical protein KC19_8G103100 [Ceratodon purpureus]|uniref:Uncharacterized protein n=1 Tax=Ceratodon purpureus TaxID=3225 RepID=A0A8T0GXD7_CERPU|nr:hypothetical protein KC19_8G103100 [Ceratodon purpureus]